MRRLLGLMCVVGAVGCFEDASAQTNDEDGTDGGSTSDASTSSGAETLTTTAAATTTSAGTTASTDPSTGLDTGSSGGGPVCGDEVVEGDETCDDGNMIPGDGCSGCQASGTVVWEFIDGSPEVGLEAVLAIDATTENESVVTIAGTLLGSNGLDGFARRLDDDGPNVAPGWVTQVSGDGGPAALTSIDIVVDGVLVSGSVARGGVIEPFGARYETGGGLLWSAEFDGGATMDSAALAIQRVGPQVVVAGYLRTSMTATDGVLWVAPFDSPVPDPVGVLTATFDSNSINGADVAWDLSNAGGETRLGVTLDGNGTVLRWTGAVDETPDGMEPLGDDFDIELGELLDRSVLSVAVAEDGSTFACTSAGNGPNRHIELLRVDEGGLTSETPPFEGPSRCAGIDLDSEGNPIVVGTVEDGVEAIAVAKIDGNSMTTVWTQTIRPNEGEPALGRCVAVGVNDFVYVGGEIEQPGVGNDRDAYAAKLVP